MAGGYQVAMRDLDQPGPDYCAKYDVEDVVISQPVALAVSLENITNVSCFTEADGAIEVTVSGGTVAVDYDYQWYRVTGTGNIALSLGSVNPATTLTAGDYRVRVTDDNSCSIWSDVYTVTEPASAPAITVVANNSVTTPGGNDGSITISISGGTPGYDVTWYDVDGTTVLDNDVLSIYNLSEGTYNVEVEDDNGCPVSRDITVSDPDAALNLSVLSAVNPVLCPVAQSGSIELEANGGTQPYTFTLTKRLVLLLLRELYRPTM
ncbi:SprB repeat-containing protein [Geofilum rubicundum]|uniref:SprB repeat-containing protein n=1 Tax=Geofilum rubicundum TaxID=472113 RepID=UPI000A68B4E6|nr:SprB repeat-containing protein [Geofilum rubicundum]